MGGTWAKDEDRMLGLLVSTLGPQSWLEISTSMGRRTAKQCRERYHNFLKPDLVHTPITIDEAKIIVVMVAQHGRRWAMITKSLKGRSENAVKNWWYSYAHRQRRITRGNTRLESERQMLEDTDQAVKSQPTKNKTTQSTHSQITPQHMHGHIYYHNWSSKPTKVKRHTPGLPSIDKKDHTSTSIPKLDPSTRILPPIAGLQRMRRPAVQQMSPVLQSSPMLYTSPSHHRSVASPFDPPSIFVTPPNHGGLPGERLYSYSHSVNQDSSLQSIQDRSLGHVDRGSRSAHHASTQMMMRQDMRSRENIQTSSGGVLTCKPAARLGLEVSVCNGGRIVGAWRMERLFVFVTGANTGLGLEIVKALCKSTTAYHIFLGSRDPVKGEEAAKQVQQELPSTQSTIQVIQTDLSSDDSLEKAIETISSTTGHLDILINNAGASFDGQIKSNKMSIREAWNASWDTNVSGTQVLTTLAIPLLLKSSNPRLLFMTSGTSSLIETDKFDHPAMARINASPEKGWPKDKGLNPIVSYRSTKTGLNMLMRDWCRVLKNDGVKVWAISPGFLATGLGGVGPGTLKKMGALDPSVGGGFTVDVVEGKYDEHVGKVIRKDMIQPW
ncbi:NAD(P)-binding protein [Aureobasidium pullulans]|uniref:NAD(P)-binding protein n=1 Tax=Aureobasidium pullulans TaxID=5580 RepID=A0A4S8YRH5_AURPU|nr:NAD(P)-binding protein [Aureobasidium pullulans]